MNAPVETLPITQLEDLKRWVQQHPGLSATRRRDLASSLTSLGRLLDRDLACIPLDITALRRELQSIHPRQAGISKKRLQNLSSDLLAAIRLYRNAVPGSGRLPLSAEWQALLDQLTVPRLHKGLSAFMRFCSREGIGPSEVSDSVVVRYIDYLQTETFRRNPRQRLRAVPRLWNEARDTVSDWPDIELAVPSFRKPPSSLPMGDFPPSFQQELEAHLAWAAGNDLLSDHQPPHYLKPRTIRLRRKHIQLLASAAVQAGIPVDRIDSLDALVSEPVMRAALGRYLEKRGSKPSAYLRDLAKTLFAIAKYWCRVPDDRLGWIRERIRRLDPGNQGLTPKNRAVLNTLESEENLLRLLVLPQRLRDQAQAIAHPVRRAVRMQMALVIEILLMAPMRIGNLAALRLDRQIVRPAGPRGPVLLVLGEDETKNGVPQEYPLPSGSVELLDAYLRHHRPVLLQGTESPWLWPGSSGGHKSDQTLRQQFTEIVYRETGLRMTPHQCRHLSAKLMLDRQPGSYETVRRVLGHKSIKTTTNFYAGMETRSAVAHYDEQVLALRDRGTKGRGR